MGHGEVDWGMTKIDLGMAKREIEKIDLGMVRDIEHGEQGDRAC